MHQYNKAAVDKEIAPHVADATAAAAGKKYEFKSGKTELFTMEKPDEVFVGRSQLIKAIFARPTAQPFSSPERDGTDFFVFKVIDSKEPAQLTLEEATDKIREILLGKKTNEALEAAAKDASEKIMTELKAGAKIADAVTKAGYTAVKIPAFEGGAVPPDASALRVPLSETVAGQIGEPVIDDEKATLVYIASRTLSEEVEKTAEEKKKTIGSQLTDYQYKNTLFEAWLQKARAEADPKPDDLGLGRNVL